MDSDMDNATLRKVQLVQLEIAKEIDRICRENDIAYFLGRGHTPRSQFGTKDLFRGTTTWM